MAAYLTPFLSFLTFPFALSVAIGAQALPCLSDLVSLYTTFDGRALLDHIGDWLCRGCTVHDMRCISGRSRRATESRPSFCQAKECALRFRFSPGSALTAYAYGPPSQTCHPCHNSLLALML
jgi:hypothetical protein